MKADPIERRIIAVMNGILIFHHFHKKLLLYAVNDGIPYIFHWHSACLIGLVRVSIDY